VHRLQHVSGEEKAWLLANATLLLYPTSAEGFGFVPHEAAALGTPSAYSGFGPLAEYLPPDQACSSWRVAEYAAHVRELLERPAARDDATAAIREAGQALTWQAAGGSLVHAFRRALAMSPQPWGLWERTEADGVGGTDPSAPMDPEELAAALGRATFGRGWRTKTAAKRARTFAAKVRRRVRSART
jgi:hypothetical protein